VGGRSRDGRLGAGAGSGGSSFRILIKFDRLAGVARAGSGGIGVELGRIGSGTGLKVESGREVVGEWAGDCR
jgi:hypothetical protein